MGMLLVLREPSRAVRAKRLTRAQRREQREADATWWAVAVARGRVVDVDVDLLIGLIDAAGPARLQLFGLLSPWADTVLDPADLGRMDADLDLFAEVTAADPAPDRQEVIAALRALAARWRADPSLELHCIGD